LLDGRQVLGNESVHVFHVAFSEISPIAKVLKDLRDKDKEALELLIWLFLVDTKVVGVDDCRREQAKEKEARRGLVEFSCCFLGHFLLFRVLENFGQMNCYFISQFGKEFAKFSILGGGEEREITKIDKCRVVNKKGMRTYVGMWGKEVTMALRSLCDINSNCSRLINAFSCAESLRGSN